jgi:hypothetical protein
LQVDGEDLQGRCPGVQFLLLARLLLLEPLQLAADGAAPGEGSSGAALHALLQQQLPSWYWWSCRCGACRRPVAAPANWSAAPAAALLLHLPNWSGAPAAALLLHLPNWSGAPAAALLLHLPNWSGRTLHCAPLQPGIPPGPRPAPPSTYPPTYPPPPCRVLITHQHVLSHSSATLKRQLDALELRRQAWAQAQSSSGSEQGALLLASAQLEAAQAAHTYGYIEAARRQLQAAGEVLGLQVEITGAMGAPPAPAACTRCWPRAAPARTLCSHPCSPGPRRRQAHRPPGGRQGAAGGPGQQAARAARGPGWR